jgi:hypothetical protein
MGEVSSQGSAPETQAGVEELARRKTYGDISEW